MTELDLLYEQCNVKIGDKKELKKAIEKRINFWRNQSNSNPKTYNLHAWKMALQTYFNK